MTTTSGSAATSPLMPSDCHQIHQQLLQIIRQQEEEIQQLRDLLLDVVDRQPVRSVHASVSAYERTLTQLQTRFDQLQQGMICTQPNCVSVQPDPVQEEIPCADTRFGLTATLEQHVQTLMEECNRIKSHCLQFLSGMMSLNWL